jgi:transposase
VVATSLCQSVGRYPPPHRIWSHETITLQGLPLTVKAAHMKLSHSRMPFVRVYFRETQELVFDAHDKAFQFYGGVCRRGIYDNLWTSPAQGDLLVRRLECTNLSGLLRDGSRPWP